MKYAIKLALAAVGGGLMLAAVLLALNPPAFVVLVLFGNAAIAVWWGIHVFVTRRPW